MLKNDGVFKRLGSAWGLLRSNQTNRTKPKKKRKRGRVQRGICSESLGRDRSFSKRMDSASGGKKKRGVAGRNCGEIPLYPTPNRPLEKLLVKMRIKKGCWLSHSYLLDWTEGGGGALSLSKALAGSEGLVGGPSVRTEGSGGGGGRLIPHRSLWGKAVAHGPLETKNTITGSHSPIVEPGKYHTKRRRLSLDGALETVCLDPSPYFERYASHAT